MGDLSVDDLKEQIAGMWKEMGRIRASVVEECAQMVEDAMFGSPDLVEVQVNLRLDMVASRLRALATRSTEGRDNG